MVIQLFELRDLETDLEILPVHFPIWRITLFRYDRGLLRDYRSFFPSEGHVPYFSRISKDRR